MENRPSPFHNQIHKISFKWMLPVNVVFLLLLDGPSLNGQAVDAHTQVNLPNLVSAGSAVGFHTQCLSQKMKTKISASFKIAD